MLAKRRKMSAFIKNYLSVFSFILGCSFFAFGIERMLTIDNLKAFEEKKLIDFEIIPKSKNRDLFFDGKNLIFSLKEIGKIGEKEVKLSIKDVKNIKQYSYLFKNVFYFHKGIFLSQILNFDSDVNIIEFASSEYFNSKNLELILGSYLSKNDFSNQNNNILLSEWAAFKKFGRNNPIGQKVLFYNDGLKSSSTLFTVVGVFRDISGYFRQSDIDTFTTNEERKPIGIGVWGGAKSSISYYPSIDIPEEIIVQLDRENAREGYSKLSEFVSKFYGSTVTVRSNFLDNEKIFKKVNFTNTILVTPLILILFLSITGVYSNYLLDLKTSYKSIGILRSFGASKNVIFQNFLLNAVKIGFSAGIISFILAFTLEKINLSLNSTITHTGSINLFYLSLCLPLSIFVFLFCSLIPISGLNKSTIISLLKGNL
jgi:ABC-type antimicrobial peptide transport system permease subunit